jgi:hypothetical protein
MQQSNIFNVSAQHYIHVDEGHMVLGREQQRPDLHGVT